MLTDVLAALARGRNCLLLTQWAAQVALLADLLRAAGHDPVVLRGGMGVGQRRDALEQLQPDGRPLLVVATGPYVGEGFDCPALDTVFLAAPIAFKGRLVQYVGRALRAAPGKHVVEVHDYRDIQTGVLASSMRKRAPAPRRRSTRQKINYPRQTRNGQLGHGRLLDGGRPRTMEPMPGSDHRREIWRGAAMKRTAVRHCRRQRAWICPDLVLSLAAHLLDEGGGAVPDEELG